MSTQIKQDLIIEVGKGEAKAPGRFNAAGVISLDS